MRSPGQDLREIFDLGVRHPYTAVRCEGPDLCQRLAAVNQ